MTSIGLPGDAGPARGASVGRWGMVLFLLNEATLFACLISSYFYVALTNRTWPPAGIRVPSLPLPLTMTVLLLASSAALVYGERGLDRGNPGRHRVGTVIAIALGAAFLLVQAKEYADMLGEVHPTAHAYGSLFFSITGLHGTHVAFGLLLLLWSLLVPGRQPSSAGGSLAISNVSLYWHFVDGVWIVILTSQYLSPRWW